MPDVGTNDSVCRIMDGLGSRELVLSDYGAVLPLKYVACEQLTQLNHGHL